ncbi:MAG: Gldg family protein [Polyangiaceae bacterium]|nr:Gldg family protein [Polyangiaceae bacterium]MCW5792529.1 Gldg family protein [Polyangiaceae bacterium]
MTGKGTEPDEPSSDEARAATRDGSVADDQRPEAPPSAATEAPSGSEPPETLIPSAEATSPAEPAPRSESAEAPSTTEAASSTTEAPSTSPGTTEAAPGTTEAAIVPAAKPKRRSERLVIWIGIGSIALMSLIIISVWAAWPSKDTREEDCREATAALLRSTEQVLVTLYVSPETRALERAGADLERQLKALGREAEGKLELRRVEVVGESERAEAAKAGLSALPVPAGEQASAPRYLGLVLESGEARVVIPTYEPEHPERFGFWFSGKLRELAQRRTGEPARVSVLASSWEGVNQQLRPGVSLAQVLKSSFGYLTLSELSLESVGDHGEGRAALDRMSPAQVEEHLNHTAWLLTPPSSDLSPAMLRVIDGFLMRGDRTLVIATGAAHLSMGDLEMRLELSRRGLEQLLEGYGVELREDLIWEPEASLRLSRDGMKSFAAPYLLRVSGDRLTNEEPPFAGLSEVTVPLASTLKLYRDKQPDAKFEVLMRTTREARALTASGVSLAPSAPAPTETELAPAEERIIAVRIFGSIKSAYSDQKAKGEVIVIASTGLFANPYLRATSVTPTNALWDPNRASPALTHAGAAYTDITFTSSVVVGKNLLDLATGTGDSAVCGSLLFPRAP